MGENFFVCALWAYYPFILSGYTYALPVVQIKISIFFTASCQFTFSIPLTCSYACSASQIGKLQQG